MNIDCISCTTSLSENSTFCFNCGTRVKCSYCEKVLVNGAKFCSECGTSIEIKVENNSVEKNTLTYRKTKDGVFCDVSLSNEVGKEGIKELIQGLTSNQTPSYKQLGIGNLAEDKGGNKNGVFDDAEIIDAHDNKEISNNENEGKIEMIPHLKDVEMTVNCNEGQWILIYAFYESDFATKTFTKSAVYEKYMAKRKTDSRIKNFAAYWKSLFKNYIATVNDTTFKFKPEKLNTLKQLILGNGKSSASSNTSSTGAKKSNTIKESDVKDKKNNKSVKSNSLSYSLVTDLNLNPKGQPSLKDFFARYKAKGPENILLVVHYLQKILERKKIDVNAIYTCYKHIPLKIPNILQYLRDVKARQGWIITTDYSDLKLSVGGENYIEFEMTKVNS